MVHNLRVVVGVPVWIFFNAVAWFLPYEHHQDYIRKAYGFALASLSLDLGLYFGTQIFFIFYLIKLFLVGIALFYFFCKGGQNLNVQSREILWQTKAIVFIIIYLTSTIVFLFCLNLLEWPHMFAFMTLVLGYFYLYKENQQEHIISGLFRRDKLPIYFFYLAGLYIKYARSPMNDYIVMSLRYFVLPQTLLLSFIFMYHTGGATNYRRPNEEHRVDEEEKAEIVELRDYEGDKLITQLEIIEIPVDNEDGGGGGNVQQGMALPLLANGESRESRILRNLKEKNKKEILIEDRKSKAHLVAVFLFIAYTGTFKILDLIWDTNKEDYAPDGHPAWSHRIFELTENHVNIAIVVQCVFYGILFGICNKICKAYPEFLDNQDLKGFRTFTFFIELCVLALSL